MPTEIYKTDYIYTIDNEEILLAPLCIFYMKEFMVAFDYLKDSVNDDEAINILSECCRIAMKQYNARYSDSIETIQDNFSLHEIYKIIEVGAGIKIKDKGEDSNIADNIDSSSDSTWENLDLAKLETEAFLVGIWKNFHELEMSLSIHELITILSTRRELDHEEKKFLAAIQGIDLDGGSEQDSQKAWEDLKARVYSKGQAKDSKDILALQGQTAQQLGFGIGMGLDYEDLRQTS